MQYKERGSLVLFYFWMALFRGLLDLAYWYWLEPNYAYGGFYIGSETFFTISWLALLPFGYLFYHVTNGGKPVTLYEGVMLVFLYMAFLPSSTVLAYRGESVYVLLHYYGYWLVFLLLSCLFRRIKVPRALSLSWQNFPTLLLILLGGVVLYVNASYSGFRIFLSVGDDVYKLRAEASSYSMPVVLSYLIAMSASVLPFLVVYFWKRDKILAFVALIFSVLLYSIGAHKFIFFFLLIGIVVLVYPRICRLDRIPLLFSGLLFASSFEPLLTGSILVGSYVRRIFYVPALLNLDYYAFFTTHEPDYFRQSFLRHFGMHSPYSIPIPTMLGQWKSLNSNLNNGLFSDAVMNFGSYGWLLGPIYCVGILYLLSYLSSHASAPLRFMAVVAVALGLISGTAFSSLLNGGLLLLVLLIWLGHSDSRINRYAHTS